MDNLISQDGGTPDCANSIGTTLSDILLLLQTFFAFLFNCDSSYAAEDAYEEEKGDWSSILVFIMMVKCRSTIGKILNADDDD